MAHDFLLLSHAYASLMFKEHLHLIERIRPHKVGSGVQAFIKCANMHEYHLCTYTVTHSHLDVPTKGSCATRWID